MNKTLVPFGIEQVRRIDVIQEFEDALNRFGGKAPERLVPRDQSNKYWLTIQLEQDVFLSIFLKDDAEYFIYGSRTRINYEDTAVDLLFHPYLPRRIDSRFESKYPARTLMIGPLEKDEHRDGKDVFIPDGSNKLGGKAFLIEEHSTGAALVADIEKEGFCQLLQIDASTIGPFEISEKNPYPYGFGIMHVYLKRIEAGYTWCSFVDS